MINVEIEDFVLMLRAVLESTTDGILIIDQEGEIVEFNQNFLKMWQLSFENLDSLNDLLPQLADPGHMFFCKNRLRDLSSSKIFETLKLKDGRLIQCSSIPHQLVKTPRIWVFSFRDITDSIRYDYLSIASHELKTPLTSLSLQNQMIRQIIQSGNCNCIPKDKTDSLFSIAHEQVERLGNLIDNLLNVPRDQGDRINLKLEMVSLSELIRSVVNRSQFELEESGCEIYLELDDTLVGEWDCVRMEQVLINLLTNGMKYGKHHPLLISTRQDQSCIYLSVRDHGIGIAQEDQGRVFERYGRAVAVKDYAGLGLGLYIVKNIVEAHGGQIRLESKLGEGSNFIVELPVLQKNGTSLMHQATQSFSMSENIIHC